MKLSLLKYKRKLTKPYQVALVSLTCLALGWALFPKSASALPKTETNIYLDIPSGKLAGTLEMPTAPTKPPVVLLLSGSGPTDRDGNQKGLRNNALKHIALGLKASGIASLRYDKRGIAQSKKSMTKESEMRFDHYIQDAQAWISRLKMDPRFDRVIVMGHSEGSLVGMVAAKKEGTAGFVSLAGAGFPIGLIIRRQLKAQSSTLAKKAEPVLLQLEKGQTVKKYPLILASLFRPSVQPYIISWLKYDPRQEISKLEQPVLIVQGNHDLQVSEDDAGSLFQSQPQSKKHIIKGMNHVLKSSPLKRAGNLKTYIQPNLPLHSELLSLLIEFIHSTKK